jgi:prepilin-type processing-associated H-X9-DG protein
MPRLYHHSSHLESELELGGWTTEVDPTNPARVVKPTGCIAMADSNWDVKTGGDPNWSGFIGMYAERQWPLDLHSSTSENGHANINFCDGHVEGLKRPAFVSSLNSSVGASNAADCIWNFDNQYH